MIQAKRFDHAEAALKKYLLYHGKNAEPWMYEWLVKTFEARKHTDQEVKMAIGYAARLAKRSKNPNDLIRLADMMVVRDFYGKVGDPGFETDIGELVDLAAEKVPANAIPSMMSINLASKIKDPKRMGDAADALLSLGWPGIDDTLRRDAKQQVKNLEKVLRDDGKTADADALDARFIASEVRDVYAKLTWAGEADIDLIVDEPLGATAQFKTPRTVFGGAIIKNGFGRHPEEVYVCPRAFPGDYTFKVESIFVDPNRPAVEATLEVILHEGGEHEQRQTHRFDLVKADSYVVKLIEGRRKVVLPFIPPPSRPTPPEPTAGSPSPKPTQESAKEAPKAAPGRSVPIR